jgi:CheY-like chemotaxis protein
MPLILIVEDDDAVREMLVETVEGFGYQVISAANAGDAVISATSTSPTRSCST